MPTHNPMDDVPIATVLSSFSSLSSLELHHLDQLGEKDYELKAHSSVVYQFNIAQQIEEEVPVVLQQQMIGLSNIGLK